MPNTSKGVEIDQVREKLIELIKQSLRVMGGFCSDAICKQCKYEKYGDDCGYAIRADHLIANGVTVQEWISVKDRLPEDVYGKDREKIVVLVCTESGNVSQCARIADYDCSTDAKLTQVKWTKNGQFYWSKGKRVTHWMPMPQPPEGE